MKRLFILTTFLLGISPICLNAQELTLEECQQQAQAHYPLIKRYGLIEKTKEYNISNAGKGYLPQVSLSAKASYQSDVTEIPVDLPGIDIRGIRKDQYQAMLQLEHPGTERGNPCHIRSRQTETGSGHVCHQRTGKPTFFWHPVIERAIEAKPAYAGRITKEL